jgi:hypothetical protein
MIVLKLNHLNPYKDNFGTRHMTLVFRGLRLIIYTFKGGK